MRNSRLLAWATATLFVASGTTIAVTAVTVANAPAAGAATKLPTCNLKALAAHKGAVDITFWNSMSGTNGKTLATITNSFNSSQSKVHVTLVEQSGYDDTWQKYEAGLTNGELPDAVQLEDQRTQEAIDTKSFLPVQSCINAAKYSTSDYLARTLDYWKVNGVQEALPFAVSAPVVYYNKLAFTKAGLNPDDPPATLPAMLTDSRALKASGSGMALVLDAWHLETWLATANQPFVNNNNGRSGRASKGVFDTSTAKQIFTDLDTLVKSGDATTNPSSGPSEYDNLLGMASGKYGMTIDSSADLGTITQLLGKYPNVKLGVGAFPALSSSIRGGIEPGGSGVYISDKAPALDQAASWEFLSYLCSTQSQATWAAGTGYIPVRKSSAASPTITHLWATNPGFKVAYDEVNDGADTPATSGSVIGPYADVRIDVLNAEEAMYTSGVSPAKTLSHALSAVNATISGYNSRLGG